jgi:uncharacterized integral membrane protein (TIGR00698 family)
MPFSKEKRTGTISGIIFVALVAAAATYIADLPVIKHLGVSSLVIGIVIGIFYANTLHNHFPAAWESGIVFTAKKILRFAIVFYGFHITFQDIANVGPEGFFVSLTMLTTTFLLGTFIGTKVFGMDRDTSMLTAAGGAVCGAAAVLATEPVLKAEEHKAAVGVSMVVVFGTIAMFLYPALYETIIKPATGFLHLTPAQFGIYAGGSVHEVAQVIGAIASVPGYPAVMMHNAVIVKLTRVILIAPMLIFLGLYLSYSAKKDGSSGGGVKLVIPWFAVYFVVMAGVNSLIQMYLGTQTPEFANTVNGMIGHLKTVDTFLLAMAMTALGMGTRFAKFKGLGLKPLYTAGVMFGWLIVGGFLVTKFVVSVM